MYTYPWYHWITFFYIYCFFGWIFESAYVSIKTGHFVNRGFLRLPMLPLYGTAAVMMLWFSLPVRDNLFLVYLSGFVTATILEYVTGYVMERLFKMRYWDYSDQKFNVHGYICLGTSIVWGFLTIFLTRVIHKPVAGLVLALNPIVEFVLIGIVSVLFISDAVKSVKEALDLGHALEAMTRMKAELEEMQVQLALLKAETNQRVAEFKEEAAQKMVVAAQKLKERPEREARPEYASRPERELRTEYTPRPEHELRPDLQVRSERESVLSDRIKALTESRHTLSHQMSFYRKGILRGNPTSSSNRFAEALKELKDSVDNFKNQRKAG